TEWHPSQSLRSLPDGSIVMRLRVASTTEILHWVLGWGSACEVVAPQEFRHQVEAEVVATAALYAREPTPLAALRELVDQVAVAPRRAVRRSATEARAAG